MQSKSTHLKCPTPKPEPETLKQWDLWTKPKVKNAAYTKFSTCKDELEMQTAIQDARLKYPTRILKVEEIHITRRTIIER